MPVVRKITAPVKPVKEAKKRGRPRKEDQEVLYTFRCSKCRHTEKTSIKSAEMYCPKDRRLMDIE